MTVEDLPPEDEPPDLEEIMCAPPVPYCPAGDRLGRARWARDRRADGAALRQIGQWLGVSASTVRRYLDELRG